MGEAVPMLLEQTIQMVGTNTDSDAHLDNGTVGGPGPCKKRRVLNTLELARMRLEYLCDEDGENGLCQHAVWDDLKAALQDLRQGQEVFHYITRHQWGDQVAQGGHGIAQTIAAVETAIAATVEGDMDWLTEGWSQVVGLLLQEGEELFEEESQLDYVHPADVVALSEGAQEEPARPPGDVAVTVDRLLRNVQAVLHFVPKGGDEFRRLQAAIIVWRQRFRGESIYVDTQTTEGGDAEPAPPTDEGKWIPPLDAEQWTGSLPSSGRPADSQEGDVHEPTDEDLLQALEEFEKQEQEEALQEALGGQLDALPEEDQLRDEGGDAEHRRRRMHAAEG